MLRLILSSSLKKFDFISALIKKNDTIFVSGGNSFFLLQELIKSGTGKLIMDLGKIYIGESAGSIILSPDIGYIKEMDDTAKALLLKLIPFNNSRVIQEHGREVILKSV